MNLIDVHKLFDTEDQCYDYLERMRWPQGVRCVACGSERVSGFRSSSRKQKIRRLYQCLDCLHQFTATSGTIFHDTHLPLQKWFMAIALIVDAKKGMSARQLQRHLDVNYRTAWYLAHRIRKAMEDEFQLTGKVEIDETYVGGKKHGAGVRGRGTGKPAVVGLKQRGGKLKFIQAPNVKADTLHKIIMDTVSKRASMVLTDDFAAYQFAVPDRFRGKHKTVCHKHQFVNGDIHVNGCENAFSLLKRGIIGSYHRISVKHLWRYLNEFEFRFNGRELPNLFGETLKNMLRGGNMPYKVLIADVEGA